MNSHTNSLKLRATAALALVAMLSACGPSTVSGPVSVSGASFTTSTTGSTTLPLLSTSGYAVTGSIGATSAAASITEALSVAAPSGVTPLSEGRAQAQSTRTTQSGSGSTDLLYVTFTSSQTITLAATPTLTFSSNSIVAGTAYSLAVYLNGSWTAPAEGPVTATGTTITFPSISQSVTLTANTPVTFLLYSGTALVGPTATTASLTFDATNPSTQTFSVAESNYSGAFNASIACTENPAGQTPGSNAFVAQFQGGSTTSSQTPSSAGASVTFTVASGAETGSCTITVTDTKNGSTTVGVTVSSTSVTISGKQLQ